MNNDKDNIDVTSLPSTFPLNSGSDTPLPSTFPLNVGSDPPLPESLATFSTDSISPRSYEDIAFFRYNGSHSQCDYENSQIALALALSASAAEIKTDPHEVFLNFMESFHGNKFSEALTIYKNGDIESKQLINFELDEIPWRVASEYLIKDKRLHWINSWVKIGWWHQEIFEIPPQYSKGQWLTEDIKHSNAINTNYFECTVLEGKGKEMLHKLLAYGNIVNIELEQSEGYLIPVNVAFKYPKSMSNVFDLADVEVGSLDPLEDHSLDILRVHNKTVSCQDGSKIKFFRGCTIGAAFIPESEIVASELIEGNLEDTTTLADVDDLVNEEEI